MPTTHKVLGQVAPAEATATTLYTVPAADVVHKLTPFHLTYDTLDIPPHASSRFSGACALDASYETAVGSTYAWQIPSKCLMTGIVASVTQAAGWPGAGRIASPKVLVVLV